MTESRRRWRGVRAVAGWLIVAAVASGACESGLAPPTPPIVPGNAAAPREVNIVAKDYSFLPATLDLVPGETVLLHVINGGLDIHEAIIGDSAVQDAWEGAEAAVDGGPPGAVPSPSVPPDLEGLRILVRSGERVDVMWTVPVGADDGVPGLTAGGAEEPFFVGCHIPGHWALGMKIPVRWVDAP